MSESIRITEVAPRDGLQNEPTPVPTATKADLVRRLVRYGPAEIEVTSFVSPKWIPQLGDAADLLALLASEERGNITYSALVPNTQGLERLEDANRAALNASGRRIVDKVSVFAAASETFSRKNTNASIAETLDRFAPVIERARSQGLQTRGYVSCMVACPFEGAIQPDAVAAVAVGLAGLGIGEIDLGDTIGAGTPETIGRAIEAVGGALSAAGHAAVGLTLHLHDTHGLAAACVDAALDMGVRSFDSAAGGLGGCPYASTPDRRAPGNIGTLVLVAAARRAGYTVEVDDRALELASEFAGQLRSGDQVEHGSA